MRDSSLLTVRDLRVEFPGRCGAVQAVNGVSFEIREGETLGLVGETGCGKSTVARAVIGLLPSPGQITAGSIHLGDIDLVSGSPRELRRIRGNEVAMVFQDTLTALNPLMTVGAQIAEALRIHTGLRGPAARRRVTELLDLVGLPDASARLSAYPHELSGGMRQRVMIALAVSCSPRLLIADEPTTALDVTVQAQILELLRHLRDEFGMAILLISHDLGVMAGMADRVHVMYAGFIVEEGSVEDVLLAPRHPYTEGLIGSIAKIDMPRPRRLASIPGTTPTLLGQPRACPFRPRCPVAVSRCESANPPLLPVGPGHTSACWVRGGEEQIVPAVAETGGSHGTL